MGDITDARSFFFPDKYEPTDILMWHKLQLAVIKGKERCMKTDIILWEFIGAIYSIFHNQ